MNTRRLLLVPALFIAVAATAQRRSVGSTVLQPELQVECALKGDDYVFGGFSLLARGEGGGSTFSAAQLRFGYERFWNDRWSGGGMLNINSFETGTGGDVYGMDVIITPELFVRHWNTLGAFNFRQRLGIERGIPLAVNAEGRAITRLRLDLDRVFALGEKLALRPRLSYEAAAYLRLQRDEEELKERVIDFGALRAEVGCRVSPRVDFTPWVAYSTTYINALEQTDIDGNVTGGGRTNLVTPVVGLDVRLTLFRGGAPFERRQLPTQH